MLDNREVEEQERRSRASSPFSSVSSSTKNGKPIVIIASNPNHASEAADLYEEAKVNFTKATNFAELSKLSESLGGSAINIVYMQQDKDSSQGCCSVD